MNYKFAAIGVSHAEDMTKYLLRELVAINGRDNGDWKPISTSYLPDGRLLILLSREERDLM